MTMSEETPIAYHFTDPVSGRVCDLTFIGPDPSWWDHTAGVAHPDCSMLADVSAEIDAFYCPECRWNGRLSGMWATDCLRAARRLFTKEDG